MGVVRGQEAELREEAEPETNEEKGMGQRRGLERVVTYGGVAVREVAVSSVTAELRFRKRGTHIQERASVGHRREGPYY